MFITVIDPMIKDAIHKGSLTKSNIAKGALVFTFGVSGAGKTHTMIGSPSDGLFPETINRLLAIRDETLDSNCRSNSNGHIDIDNDSRARQAISRI